MNITGTQQQADDGQPGQGERDERERRRHPLYHVLLLALVIIVAISVGRAMTQLFFPWLLIGLLALLWLGHRARRDRTWPDRRR
jgi:predicted membrane metal-binding protein